MKVTYMEIATASGKRGGVVGGAWKGIQYLRKRVIPSNPRTLSQQAQRGKMSAAVSAVVTFFKVAAQKQLWIDWAALNPFRSKNGMGSQFLPAFQAAVAVGLTRLTFGLAAQIDMLPTITVPEIPLDGSGDPIITLSQSVAGGIAINYPTLFFTTADWFQFLEFVPGYQTNLKADITKARVTAVIQGDNTPTPVGGVDIDGGGYSAGMAIDVWASRYQAEGKQSTVPMYLGRYIIT